MRMPTKRYWIFLSVVLFLLAGSGWYFWQETVLRPVAARPEERPERVARPTKPPVSPETKAPSPTVEKPVAVTPDSSERVVLSGSQRALTALRAELEERKLQVAISEQLAKLEKASAPAPLPVAPVLLPPLPELSTSTTSVSLTSSTLPGSKRSTQPVVVSVQGVSGSALTANIRLTGGRLMTARQGDRVSGENGGTVVSISRDGVKLRRGGTVETLPFE